MSVDKRKFKNRLLPSQITWACLGGVGREGLRFPLIMLPKGECSGRKRILTPFVAFKHVQTLNQLFDNILYASLTRGLSTEATFTDTHITIHNEIHTLIKGSGLDRHPPPLHQAQVAHVRNITIGSPAKRSKYKGFVWEKNNCFCQEPIGSCFCSIYTNVKGFK